MTVRKEFRVDGRDNYAVDLVPQSDGSYKLYASHHPSDPHGKNSHETHLYSNKEICVAARRKPKTLAQATEISKAWCEGYSRYRRTGKFPD
jgi:hypothetical protein